MMLNFKQLKASLNTAAKGDARYYLNAVYVESLSDSYRLVSTDGRHMGVFHNANITPDIPSVLIPRETIEALPKQKSDDIELRFVNDEWRLGALSFKPVEGGFPDYRRVLPREPSGQVAHYPAPSFGIFQKVADAIGKRGANVRIWHNGNDAAGVTIAKQPEYFGMVMPIRSEAISKLNMDVYPSWLKY